MGSVPATLIFHAATHHVWQHACPGIGPEQRLWRISVSGRDALPRHGQSDRFALSRTNGLTRVKITAG